MSVHQHTIVQQNRGTEDRKFGVGYSLLRSHKISEKGRLYQTLRLCALPMIESW